MKKLKINTQFIPCAALPDDEGFGSYPFVWNITTMITWIVANVDEVACSTVKILSSEKAIESESLNESHIPTLDLSKPLIIVRINPDYYRLIDGHHRVAKARLNGVEESPAYYLSEEQHRQFFIHSESDRIYVDYWNEKLEMANGKWQKST
ncbi:ParB/RepB/Spo0J family partition protein [Sporosarcina sp. FA9]|uniref:ParB/RepB/Spo0J family partition protein n=1 Tax=Sporosarcina sp. FA9 TaxID=3413030 RepID=UPI003F65EDCF